MTLEATKAASISRREYVFERREGIERLHTFLSDVQIVNHLMFHYLEVGLEVVTKGLAFTVRVNLPFGELKISLVPQKSIKMNRILARGLYLSVLNFFTGVPGRNRPLIKAGENSFSPQLSLIELTCGCFHLGSDFLNVS